MGKITFTKLVKITWLRERYEHYFSVKYTLLAALLPIVGGYSWVGFLCLQIVFLVAKILCIIFFYNGYFRYYYFLICEDLDLGGMAIIPNTQIIAYKVRDKKDDFELFDYDGAVIVSLYRRIKGVECYTNLRVEYDKFDKLFAGRISVGSFRSQLGTKWGKRLIVDLNDPDYKEKYFARLKEAEDARKK